MSSPLRSVAEIGCRKSYRTTTCVSNHGSDAGPQTRPLCHLVAAKSPTSRNTQQLRRRKRSSGGVEHMTGLDRADTDAIALLEMYPSPTSRPATSTPPRDEHPARGINGAACSGGAPWVRRMPSQTARTQALQEGSKGCATGGRTCLPTSVGSRRRPEPGRSGKPVNVDAAAGSGSRPPWVQSLTWAWRHSWCELASSGVATAVYRCRRRNQRALPLGQHVPRR